MVQVAQQALTDQVRSAFKGQGRRPVIDFLQRQRWFGGKGKPVADVRLSEAIELSAGVVPHLLAVLLVEYRGGVQERYLALLSIRRRVSRDDAAAIAAVPGSPTKQWVCDATREDDVWRTLYGVVGAEKELVGQSGFVVGKIVAGRQQEFAAAVDRVKVLSADQSNTSVVLDQRVIMKLIRKVEAGINPDSEILEFLTTQTSCRDVPPLLGLLTYDASVADERNPGTIVVVQRFVPNNGDGWNYTLTRLMGLLEDGRDAAPGCSENASKAVRKISGDFVAEIRHLGVITGNLHLALASRMEPEAFRPEPVTAHDVERWHAAMTKYLAEVCRDLRTLSPDQRAAIGLSIDEGMGWEAACRERFGDLRLLTNGRIAKIRHHGDYHLGQVLKTDEGFIVIDFEGEPARPMEERRAKACALKDVAGMLRSFNYAAHAVLKQQSNASATDVSLVKEWERAAREAFLDGYRSIAREGEAIFLPRTCEETLRVIQLYELDKALYELRYEMRSRPDWISIPFEGILAILR